MQLELEEDSFKIPLDIKIEALIGFVLGIFGTVLSHFSGMRDISFTAQFAGKTFEHFHQRRNFRNVQKTRTFVFNSFLNDTKRKFPSVEEVMRNNQALKSLIAYTPVVAK